jgi:pimeloyl-ACP methyl ester carboxylesterase
MIARLSLALLLVSSTAIAAPTIKLSPCQVGKPGGTSYLDARCGKLDVPEDRTHPEGKHIQLKVALVPALDSTPAPDPVFFLAGGPGQAATEDFPGQLPAFRALREHHDIVLVDQRGTGSSNRLVCPMPDVPTDQPADPAALIAAYRACPAKLPGDPRFYTTTVAVKDLDAVRGALGRKMIDLYGVSYGTRVALEYLREFPQHTRAVVLDGVVPADLALGPQVSLDAQHALHLMFKRCTADAACRSHFPDLAGDFHKLETQTRDAPKTLTVPDPLTAEPRRIRFGPELFGMGIRLLSYASETISLTPLLIHSAAEGDLQPLTSVSLLTAGEMDKDLASGMSNAVVCTEDVPFYTDADAALKASADTYLGGLTLRTLMAACKSWPRGVMEPDFKKPVVSNKPVLLISGSADPITPPSNAAHAAKTLSDSLQIVVQGQGHNNGYRGCIPKLINHFITRATPKGLDTKCVDKIKPAPFFVDFNGPTP